MRQPRYSPICPKHYERVCDCCILVAETTLKLGWDYDRTLILSCDVTYVMHAVNNLCITTTEQLCTRALLLHSGREATLELVRDYGRAREFSLRYGQIRCTTREAVTATSIFNM